MDVGVRHYSRTNNYHRWQDDNTINSALSKDFIQAISFRITKKTIFILLITSVEIYLSSDLVNSIPVKYFITY